MPTTQARQRATCRLLYQIHPPLHPFSPAAFQRRWTFESQRLHRPAPERSTPLRCSCRIPHALSAEDQAPCAGTTNGDTERHLLPSRACRERAAPAHTRSPRVGRSPRRLSHPEGKVSENGPASQTQAGFRVASSQNKNAPQISSPVFGKQRVGHPRDVTPQDGSATGTYISRRPVTARAGLELRPGGGRPGF